MIPGHWQPVARADGETVGYVAADGDGFLALDLLGVELGRAEWDDEARGLVVDRGLASLGRSWDWTDEAGVTRRVHVLHVTPDSVTVNDGYPGLVGGAGETFVLPLPVDPARFRPA